MRLKTEPVLMKSIARELHRSEIYLYLIVCIWWATPFVSAARRFFDNEPEYARTLAENKLELEPGFSLGPMRLGRVAGVLFEPCVHGRFGCFESLIEGEVGGIEEKCVSGGAQGRVGAIAVAFVAST